MPIHLLLLLPIVLILATAHLFPLLPRPDRLFGVAVGAEIRYGPEARQMLKAYALRLMPWTLASFVCSLLLPLRWSGVWIPCVSIAPLLAAYLLFSTSRDRAARLASPESSTRSAELTGTGIGLLRQIGPFVIPLAMLLGTGLWLSAHWNRIPARFPVHWDANGIANEWSLRTIAGVYGPLFIGSLVILFFIGISLLASWGSRKKSQHSAIRIIPVAVTWIIATAFSMVAILPLHAISLGVFFTFDAASLLFLAVMTWVSIRHGTAFSPEMGEVTPSACWHGNFVYYNSDDPALFVEKRIGIGQTLNFGNRLSWLVLALILLIPLCLVFLALKFTSW